MASFGKLAFKNIAWLFVGEVSIRVFKLILIVVIARFLGVFSYGQLSFAAAFAIILSMLANFGFSEINTRELSKGRDVDKSAIISLQWMFSAGVLICTIILSMILLSDLLLIGLICLLSLSFSFIEMSELLFSFFRSINKIKYEAITKTIQGIVVLGLGLLLIFSYSNIIGVAIAYAISSAIAFAIILYFYNKKIEKFRFKINNEAWKTAIKTAWPLGMVLFFTAIYNYIDSVMLGMWGQIVEVGWYDAAYKIILVLMIIPVLLNRGFLPLLSKFHKTEKFKRIFTSELTLLVVGMLCMIFIGISLSSFIIVSIYGLSYVPAILVFDILIIVAGVYFLIILMYQILIINDNQNKIFKITLWGAVLNIILNIILIPKYSLYGAASATLITFLAIAAIALYYARQALKESTSCS
jgi:O-antigen/teichoic acid export membrane protein